MSKVWLPAQKQYNWFLNATPADIQYLADLPFSLSVPSHGVLVVHAGLVPGIPLPRQSLYDLIEVRVCTHMGPTGVALTHAWWLVGSSHMVVGLARHPAACAGPVRSRQGCSGPTVGRKRAKHMLGCSMHANSCVMHGAAAVVCVCPGLVCVVASKPCVANKKGLGMDASPCIMLYAGY